MDAWWMCEIPYPHVPNAVLDATQSVRARRPRRWCDPHIAAQLFDDVIDEYLLCDERRLTMGTTEPHAGFKVLLGVNPMRVSILAPETRKARLLSLGTLISQRHQPVRIAEAYTSADILSRGRLELGFVKSSDTERASVNANPVTNTERHWEAPPSPRP
jgi:alkanesulfonate monooxygenase SsuD/methylene tetrahydromethanopterin reductase-like flavin-dependent oxidoreductase (luciferase family)